MAQSRPYGILSLEPQGSAWQRTGTARTRSWERSPSAAPRGQLPRKKGHYGVLPAGFPIYRVGGWGFQKKQIEMRWNNTPRLKYQDKLLKWRQHLQLHPLRAAHAHCMARWSRDKHSRQSHSEGRADSVRWLFLRRYRLCRLGCGSAGSVCILVLTQLQQAPGTRMPGYS